MTALAYDSRVMLRRSLIRMRRYPSLTIMLIAFPVLFLLLFVYVFGDTMGRGLGGGGDAGAGRTAYLTYVVPGLLAMAVGSVSQGTSILAAKDMTEGIIARFRTMPISQPSVLVGHVLGALLQTVLAVVAVFGVALLIGYRPDGGVGGLAGALGILMAAAFAFTWLCEGLGLTARTVEEASNTPMLLTLLALLGSGFAPTTGMPGPVRWFAEHQPFTPIIESVRGFLDGQVAAGDVWTALAWCAGITLVCGWWATRTYAVRPAR